MVGSDEALKGRPGKLERSAPESEGEEEAPASQSPLLYTNSNRVRTAMNSLNEWSLRVESFSIGSAVLLCLLECICGRVTESRTILRMNQTPLYSYSLSCDNKELNAQARRSQNLFSES